MNINNFFTFMLAFIVELLPHVPLSKLPRVAKVIFINI